MATRNSFFSSIPPVTKNLIIINFIIWLAGALLPSLNNTLNTYGALYYFSSPLFNAAQLFTYMFLHANFIHLLLNMFALFMFGMSLEFHLGQKKFLFFYISCGIGAAFAQEGVNALLLAKCTRMLYESQPGLTVSDIKTIIDVGADHLRHGMTFADPDLAKLNALVNVPTIGASGAVYGILLAFGMTFPNRPIYFMFIPVPIKAKYFVIGYGLIELFQGVANTSDGIAHFAHLGGMLLGLAIILYWKHKGIIHGKYY